MGGSEQFPWSLWALRGFCALFPPTPGSPIAPAAGAGARRYSWGRERVDTQDFHCLRGREGGCAVQGAASRGGLSGGSCSPPHPWVPSAGSGSRSLPAASRTGCVKGWCY